MKAASNEFFVKAQCNGNSYVRLGFVVAVLGLLAMYPSCSFARPALSLTVRVFNYAHASPQTLASAERAANYILATGGLQVVWLDCLQEAQTVQSKALCEMGWSAELPALRLISGQVTRQFQDLEFGFATVPVLATVSYEHIATRAIRDNSSSEVSTLLGCVIAHELGHLFLGSDSHSLVGIMQSHWGRDQIHQAQTGNLRFTPEQAVQLRERVQRLADRQQEISFLQAETSAQPHVLSTRQMVVLAVRAEAQDKVDQVSIHVRIYNMAQIPESKLTSARTVAENVLQQAGVRVFWQGCTPKKEVEGLSLNCDSNLTHTDISINLISHLERLAPTLHLNALGCSIIPESGAPPTIAYVDYSRVRHLAGSVSFDAQDLLGLAIVHEIGHLLLGNNSHSFSGIMRSLWRT